MRKPRGGKTDVSVLIDASGRFFFGATVKTLRRLTECPSNGWRGLSSEEASGFPVDRFY